MTTRVTLLILAAVLAIAGTSCRSTKKPKENPAVATQVEAEFKQRWLDKRVAELTAGGTEATAARAKAEQEFRDRFSYLRAAEPIKTR